MIRLAVFDIDRTLIPPETGILAKETLTALQELKKHNIPIAIASGRQMQHIPKSLREVGFDYYILSNGSYITDRDGEILHQESIDADTIRQLTEDILQRNLPMDIRYTRGFYTANPSRSFDDYLKPFASKALQEELAGLKPIVPQFGELPIACVAAIPPEELFWFEHKYPGLDFLPIHGMPLCDVNKSGISKAVGLENICRRIGIDIGEAIAFGDDRNDLELIQMAGIGVAMGEAIDAVKSAADYLTDTCSNLGVVKGLRHFGLID